MSITIEDLSTDQLTGLIERTLYPSAMHKDVSFLPSKFRREVKPQDRRAEFLSRYLIQTENFDDLVARRAGEIWQEPDIVLEVMNWAMGLFNPQKRAVNRLAVSYKKRPQRKLDGTEEQNKAFERFLRRQRFNFRARHWDRFKVAMNTIIVLPILKVDARRKPVLDFRMVTGAIAEVFEDPEMPYGSAPGVLSYMLPDGAKDPWGRPVRVCTVDSRWYVYWDESMSPSVVEHGLGVFPGSVMRATIPPDEDWWDHTTDSNLTKTTIECGVIAAAAQWTRKTQCRYLIEKTIASEEEDDDDQIMGDPEGMYVMRGSAKLSVHNITVSMKEFLEQIRALQNEALELKTGAIASLSDLERDNVTAEAAAQLHAAISEAREFQTGPLDEFETELHYVTSLLAQRAGIEDAPDPDRVAESLRMDWPALPYIDTPAARTKVWVDRTKFGVYDQVDAYMEEHDVDEHEALEQLKLKAERRAAINKILVEHNTPKDPGQTGTDGSDPALPGEHLPAQQGRVGGQESGESRREAAESAEA